MKVYISPIDKEADKVKLKIKDDIFLAYNDLLEFSNIYSKTSNAEKEIVLLGSSVNNLNEELFTNSNKENVIAELKKTAINLIDTIVDEYQDENVQNQNKLNYDYSDHLNLKKPDHITVFNCSGVTRKTSKFFSLTQISLELKLGEITSLVGENGNGKTTLLNLIAGEITPNEGIVNYPLLNLGSKLNWPKIKESIGYVKQTLLPWSDFITLKKHLQFTASMKGIRGTDNNAYYNAIVTRLDLKRYENSKWSELSGGYKLRFELAKQLIWRPKLLILDEPLAYLDIKSQLQFLNDLRNLTNSISHSMSVIISSQHLYEIETVSDNIMFIRDGKPVYNGRMSRVGAEIKYHCYELFSENELSEIIEALNIDEVIEIRKDSFNILIYTGKKISSSLLLNRLIEKNIDVKYFRNISNSTRLFFEK